MQMPFPLIRAAGEDTRTWLRLLMRGAKVCVDALRCDASKSGACVRDKDSESTIDGERGQYEYQGVDDSPDKGYPGGHFEVARLIYASKSDSSEYAIHMALSRGITHSPPTIAPATSASTPPTMLNTGRAIHINFQLRHCTMHAHSAVMKWMPPTSSSVQYTVKRKMSSGRYR